MLFQAIDEDVTPLRKRREVGLRTKPVFFEFFASLPFLHIPSHKLQCLWGTENKLLHSAKQKRCPNEQRFRIVSRDKRPDSRFEVVAGDDNLLAFVG